MCLNTLALHFQNTRKTSLVHSNSIATEGIATCSAVVDISLSGENPKVWPASPGRYSVDRHLTSHGFTPTLNQSGHDLVLIWHEGGRLTPDPFLVLFDAKV